MPAEENKTIVLKAIDRWNDPGDRTGYFGLYRERVSIHGFPPGLEGLAGLKQFYAGLWGAFPDARVTIDDLVAEGDRLAARYTFTGSHQGDFMGIPATGNHVAMPGITILRMADGKCVERWNQADLLGLIQQLGAIADH
jgi:steroid delta-isomerase-like uncharacterized protein